jgi:hypothetical protein
MLLRAPTLEAVVLIVVVSPHASEAGTSDKERSE